MLGWFLYFSIAKYVGLVMLSIFSSLYDLAEGNFRQRTKHIHFLSIHGSLISYEKLQQSNEQVL